MHPVYHQRTEDSSAYISTNVRPSRDEEAREGGVGANNSIFLRLQTLSLQELFCFLMYYLVNERHNDASPPGVLSYGSAKRT